MIHFSTAPIAVLYPSIEVHAIPVKAEQGRTVGGTGVGTGDGSNRLMIAKLLI